MKLDILVVSYHAKIELAQCLSSIVLYSAPDYRLTVHDNTAVNYPLTWLWNRFAERSRSEFLAFVNSDVVVGPGWDAEAMDLMKADGKVASASPLSNYPPHHGLAGIRKPDPDALEWIPSLTETLKKNPNRFYQGIDRRLVTGHCMILRKAAFETVAGFDETWSFANNDWNMNERLVKVGYRLGVCLHAVCLHWINASTKDARKKGLDPVFVTPAPGSTFDSLGCVAGKTESIISASKKSSHSKYAPGIVISPAQSSSPFVINSTNSPSVTPIKH